MNTMERTSHWSMPPPMKKPRTLPQVPQYSAPKAPSAGSAPPKAAVPDSPAPKAAVQDSPAPKATGPDCAAPSAAAPAGASGYAAFSAAFSKAKSPSPAATPTAPVKPERPHITYLDRSVGTSAEPESKTASSSEQPAEQSKADTADSSEKSSDEEQSAAGWSWTKKSGRHELTAQGVVKAKDHSGVYGFELGGKAEKINKRAIVLRLEPLKLGLPEFERVLSEERQSITIGSKRGSADVVVTDEAVSKKHCTLSIIGVKGELALAIVDYSTNGTFVNGERLPAKQKRFRIRSGDKLLVKDVKLDDDFGWKCDFGNTVSFFTRK